MGRPGGRQASSRVICSPDRSWNLSMPVMHDSLESRERRIGRMSGCARLGWLACKLAYSLLMAAVLSYVLAGILNDALMQRFRLRQSLPVRRAKDMIKVLDMALRGYNLEHGKPPLLPDESRLVRSDERLLTPLRGKGNLLSPCERQFIDCPLARSGIPGLRLESSSDHTASLVDSWEGVLLRRL